MVSVLVNCLSIRRPFITAIKSICKFLDLLFGKIYFKLLLKHLCILAKTFNGDIGNKEQNSIFLDVFDCTCFLVLRTFVLLLELAHRCK